MSDLTHQLRQIKADLEATEEELTHQLMTLQADLEDVRAMLERREPAAPNGARGKPAFQRKYKHNAVTLIDQILSETGHPMPISEIEDRLRHADTEFHSETIRSALKKLIEIKKVKRLAADEGARFKWVFTARQPSMRILGGVE